MPTYDYRCGNCRKRFSLRLRIEEHGRKILRCPKCKSRKVKQQLGTFYARTSKKS